MNTYKKEDSTAKKNGADAASQVTNGQIRLLSRRMCVPGTVFQCQDVVSDDLPEPLRPSDETLLCFACHYEKSHRTINAA